MCVWSPVFGDAKEMNPRVDPGWTPVAGGALVPGIVGIIQGLSGTGNLGTAVVGGVMGAGMGASDALQQMHLMERSAEKRRRMDPYGIWGVGTAVFLILSLVAILIGSVGYFVVRKNTKQKNTEMLALVTTQKRNPLATWSTSSDDSD